jgi:hypothetical protein
VILPVKGCRQHSTENWASQLTALYGECWHVRVCVCGCADAAVVLCVHAWWLA